MQDFFSRAATLTASQSHRFDKVLCTWLHRRSLTRNFKCVWYEGVALQIARDANRVDARNLDRIGELGGRTRLGQHQVSQLVETQPQVLSRVSIERGAIRQVRTRTLSLSPGTWLCRCFLSTYLR